jgi:hypothetical protein
VHFRQVRLLLMLIKAQEYHVFDMPESEGEVSWTPQEDIPKTKREREVSLFSARRSVRSNLLFSKLWSPSLSSPLRTGVLFLPLTHISAPAAIVNTERTSHNHIVRTRHGRPPFAERHESEETNRWVSLIGMFLHGGRMVSNNRGQVFDRRPCGAVGVGKFEEDLL